MKILEDHWVERHRTGSKVNIQLKRQSSTEGHFGCLDITFKCLHNSPPFALTTISLTTLPIG